jgi:hypothetical protein
VVRPNRQHTNRTRSTTPTSDDHPCPGTTRGSQVRALHRVSERYKFLHVTLAGVDEADPLVAELVLHPGSDGVGLAANHGGVQPPSQGQQLTEQLRGDTVGDQACEAGLQVGQLWSGPLGQQIGQRLKRSAGLGVAVTVPPAGTGQTQHAEQAAHHDLPGVFVPTCPPTVWAGHLGRDSGGDLVGDHGVLHRDQQVLGFALPQTQGVRSQDVAVQGEHFPDHDGGVTVIVGMHDHLHTEFHTSLSFVEVAPARALLQARRSKSSRLNSGSRARSSS